MFMGVRVLSGGRMGLLTPEGKRRGGRGGGDGERVEVAGRRIDAPKESARRRVGDTVAGMRAGTATGAILLEREVAARNA